MVLKLDIPANIFVIANEKLKSIPSSYTFHMSCKRYWQSIVKCTSWNSTYIPNK